MKNRLQDFAKGKHEQEGWVFRRDTFNTEVGIWSIQRSDGQVEQGNLFKGQMTEWYKRQAANH